DQDRLQSRTGTVGCVIAMEGVCLKARKNGRIAGSVGIRDGPERAPHCAARLQLPGNSIVCYRLRGCKVSSGECRLKIHSTSPRQASFRCLRLESNMSISVAQAADAHLKVFISYSRRNAGAADALVDALTARGFGVTIDRRDLEFGEKWQAELAEFIRMSDTVIWLLSEASIQSKWVNWELDEVAKRNKRLVPVMVGETSRDRLPRQLGEIHILPAEGLFDLARDLDTLVRLLETDRAWLKEASRLADRAHEWLGHGRNSALLLRSAALRAAERWKDSRPAKAPAPAQAVLDLILASRQAATRRQRWWIAGSAAVALGATGLAGYAFDRQREAQRQLRDSYLAQA